MKKNKGFTLIELLVVIAIIGILAAVVLSALGSARNKGNDAAIESGLNQTRIQADLYYTTSGNYLGVCDIASNNLNPKGINFMILSSGKPTGATSVKINGVGTSTLRCNVSTIGDGWAAEVPLSNGTSYYCVDYTRKGIVTSTSIGDSNAFCQ